MTCRRPRISSSPHFDDSLDQLGLVHYQIRAEDAFEIDGLFTTSITNEIDAMNSAGDTNTGEGLRLARKQMKSKAVRERSAKVVVFFTDGRPTAFRDEINGQDRVIAVPRNTSGNIRGLFDNPETLPMSQTATPDDCATVPECYGWTEATVREEARQKGSALGGQDPERGRRDLYDRTGKSVRHGPDRDAGRGLSGATGQRGRNRGRRSAAWSLLLRSVGCPAAGACSNQVARDLMVRLAK